MMIQNCIYYFTNITVRFLFSLKRIVAGIKEKDLCFQICICKFLEIHRFTLGDAVPLMLFVSLSGEALWDAQFYFLFVDLPLSLSFFHFPLSPSLSFSFLSLPLFLSLKVPLLLHLMQIFGRFRPCFLKFCSK